ncbi:MAG TPA: hypothetical protein VMV70_00300 [Gallionella sp.]|nr:hypothetical protein [Gallionella sp.]HUW75091.1 hypothetical protein [Gallionella sp.]
MKALLMYRDSDFDLQQALPWNEPSLMQDLELNTLLRAMAGEDEFMYDVAHKAILLSLQNDIDTILYRQNIVMDCLKNPAVVRELYEVAVAAIESKRTLYLGYFSDYPGAILRDSIELLQMYSGFLKTLRGIAEEHAGRFGSEGFTTLFAMIEREFGDEYLTSIQNHLTELKFSEGVLVSAELGQGNAGSNYVLRKPHHEKRNLLDRIFVKGPPAYTFHIAERDDAGAAALSKLRERGINLAANALAQSAEHIQSFFEMLRIELAFYVGCLNLHDRLALKGESVAFPIPKPAGERKHSMEGLYDVCLTLSMTQPVIGNTVNANTKSLVIITGANQGGKSSFLRSIGLAQLMMQCGMFVGAESFAAEICNGLFTHYKREEDKALVSGKLDEELGRMSEIVDHLQANSLLLFNESFAATNEREGSEIARQIVHALLEKRIKVFFVTHMYDLAHSLYDRKMTDAMFLHADRQPDGTRTFRLVEGDPLATSFGEDLYRKIFASEAAEGNAG